MKKLSEINESLWMDSIKRSNTDAERKEDSYINIRKIKPIDMGGSVLWANDDLIIDGECHFSINEINEYIKDTGWRLPTLPEVHELKSAEFSKDNNNFYLTNNNNKLTFIKRGLFHHIFHIMDDGKFYYAWTSDKYDNDNMHILSFDNDGIVCSEENSNSFMDICFQSKQDKLCVRLVKDK